MSRPRPIACACAVALVTLVAGCGSSHHSQRPAVAAYIRKVDKIELALRAPLATVTRAGSQLAAAPRKATLLGNLAQASNRQQLAQALVRIRDLQARLRALPYPPPARHLRRLLLQLTAGEADLTHQLRLISTFLPRFGVVLRPLGPAALSLERVLSQRSAYGTAAVLALYQAKARALRSFQATTQRIVTAVSRLQPPRVSAPEYHAELASLRGMGAAAGRLATALMGGHPGNVSALLAAFDRAAAITHSPAAARAEIRAIKAYDASTRRLAGLSQAITAERAHLSSTLA
ncbi:MAG TPA: hypothetical protein VFN55_14355 [Solirubrobacteraceae bacterium]|nr:hypothetical protein [Solirubrobacteraceae bacterium]